MITATRYHDIAAGHRVFQHEGKCSRLHGHGYRIHFTLAGDKDKIGRVLDFSVIKTTLCMWLETEWDHRTLLFERDPWARMLAKIDPSIVVLPINPTDRKSVV